jgi:hypothetical protein
MPLLPGYSPETNVRSSVPVKLSKSYLSHLSEAEEDGYQGTYFGAVEGPTPMEIRDGYISSSPAETRRVPHTSSSVHTDTASVELAVESEPEFVSSETDNEEDRQTIRGTQPEPVYFSEPEALPERQVHWDIPPRPSRHRTKVHYEYEGEVGEVIFFEYGVVVFFGLEERYERDILEDIERAGILKRPIGEKDWEIEACHFTVSCCASFILVLAD